LRFIALNKVRFINAAILRPIVLAAAVVLLPTVDRAEDQQVDPLHLPKLVSDAIMARFPKALLTSATKESDQRQVVYDIELKSDARKYEMDIKADGTISEIEKEIAAKELPIAVVGAVHSRFAGSEIEEAMEVNQVAHGKETLDHYEIVIDTADKRRLELVVALDGTTITQE
jgi:hypothetical protein